MMHPSLAQRALRSCLASSGGILPPHKICNVPFSSFRTQDCARLQGRRFTVPPTLTKRPLAWRCVATAGGTMATAEWMEERDRLTEQVKRLELENLGIQQEIRLARISGVVGGTVALAAVVGSIVIFWVALQKGYLWAQFAVILLASFFWFAIMTEGGKVALLLSLPYMWPLIVFLAWVYLPSMLEPYLAGQPSIFAPTPAP
jgi:hypothetical protein